MMPHSVQNHCVILKSAMSFEVAVLVIITNRKLGIKKTSLKITVSWDDTVLTGNHLQTFKKFHASLFTIDHENYTERGLRNLLRNIGN
jgi:hypothetical protein